jgi:hypothetical protein
VFESFKVELKANALKTCSLSSIREIYLSEINVFVKFRRGKKKKKKKEISFNIWQLS